MHPVLIRIGPITLYGYGLMIALGFLAAAWDLSRRASAAGLDRDRIQNLALAALLVGIVGGRALYVGLNWPQYRSNGWEIFRLDHGGLVFYGGFITGFAAVLWGIRRNRFPLWKTVDLFVPPLVLAHAFGRVGCFLNGCCYGKLASVPWAVAFPGEGIPRHPAQLYESAFLVFLFFLLGSLQRRNPRPGTVLLVYGLAYGTWRFGIEFLRGDNPIMGGGLTLFQWISLPLAGICAWLLLLRTRRK